MPPSRGALGACKPAPKALWLLYHGRAGRTVRAFLCASGPLRRGLGAPWAKVYGKKLLRQWSLVHLQHLTHLFGQIYYARFSAGGALCARAVPPRGTLTPEQYPQKGVVGVEVLQVPAAQRLLAAHLLHTYVTFNQSAYNSVMPWFGDGECVNCCCMAPAQTQPDNPAAAKFVRQTNISRWAKGLTHSGQDHC
jgi:hypothetical protein